MCIFWKCIQQTIHWARIKILKKNSFRENKRWNTLFFLSQALTPSQLIWNSYMSWSTRFVSLKLCVRFSIFDSVLFLLKFIFLFNKIRELFDFQYFNNFIIPFKIKIIENPHTALLPDLWCLSFKIQLNLKFNDIYLSWSSPKTDLVTNFFNFSLNFHSALETSVFPNNNI